MRTFTIALTGKGGHWDNGTVQLADDFETADSEALTRGVVRWLTEDVRVIVTGDAITVAEVEAADTAG